MASLYATRPGRIPDSSSAVRVFSILVGLAGALGIASLPMTGVRESLGTLAALAVLSAVAGSMSVLVPRSRVEITPGDAFVFAALIAVGPFAAPLVAIAGVVGAFVISRRSPSIRIVFNAGTLALAATAASRVHSAMLGVTINPSSQLVALFGAVGAFFLVNTLLVAAVIRLHSGAPVFRTWCHACLWTLTSSLTNGLVAFGLAATVAAIGPVGLVLGLLGCLTIAGSYREHRRATAGPRTAPAIEALVEPAEPASEPASADDTLESIIGETSFLPRVELDSLPVGGEQH